MTPVFRSRSLRLVACLAIGLMAGRIHGQGLGEPQDQSVAPAKPSGGEIRKLIRQLQNSELVQRDAAEKQLVEMGAAVLPLLPAIDARTSGELKIRLQRIRQALESTDVETFFEASLVSLTGKMTVADVVEKLEEQTGNIIQIQGDDAVEGVEVELDAADQPFWTVMNEVMSQTNLRINAFGTTSGELILSPGAPSDDASISVNGPFRVAPLSVQSTLPFGSPIGGQLQVSLQVSWEPRLQPVFMQIPMSSVTAKLGEDEELAAVNPQAAPEIPLNYGGSTTQIDLQLERPDRSHATLAELSGEFEIAVPSERHQYIFKQFGNGARQTEKYGDVTVTLEGARRNGAVHEIRILIEFGNSQGALDSFRGWIMSNEAYLLDAKDVRLENVGLQTYGMSNNAVGIAYLFQINGDPNDYKLVYESPGMITKQTVSYVLSDIALP